MLQNFVEGLSNHTGYPVAKLVGKKIWRVYDTLTCQVHLIFHKHSRASMCVRQFTNASVADTNSSCRAVRETRRDLFTWHICRDMRGGWSMVMVVMWVGGGVYTYSKTWIGQHIEMIIKALWDGWILGQVECAHSHLQNEHLLSSDWC